MYAKYWLESLKGRDNSVDLRVDGEIILDWPIEEWSENL
jgi:hypothetical protein